MTHFDELLRSAFIAGRKRGYDEARADDGRGPVDAPSFDEWRATVSGLDLSPDPGPIKVGDLVKVDRLHELHPCIQISGMTLPVVARGISSSGGDLLTLDGRESLWAIDAEYVKKVAP